MVSPRARTSGDGRARDGAAVADEAAAYSAKSLSVLEGLEAVRKRPGMYIGSTDSRGLMHCLWEILDNAVDEALGGWCQNIVVLLHEDGSVEVHDDGRGIPVDVEPRTRLSGVEVVLTKLHAGGKFGGGSYGASGGLHGVGASVVNALSSRLDVEVDRGGSVHRMSFRRGVPGVFDGDGPAAPFARKSGLRAEGGCPAGQTGTRIRFWPDRQVFTKDAAVDLEAVYARAQQTTFLVPGLEITVRDLREGALTDAAGGEGEVENSELALGVLTESGVAAELQDAGVDPEAAESLGEQSGRERVFRHAGGITEFAEFLSTGEPVSAVLRLRGTGTFTETVPVLDGKGHMSASEVQRELAVDVALRWSNHYDSVVRSFVNIVATPKGGTHVAGFERAIVKTFNEFLRVSKVLKLSEDNVTKEDCLEGATAVVTVRLAEPQFEGQTKEVLGTPEASRIVGQVVSRDLGEWLNNPPRGDKQVTKAVTEKVANAMRARVAARAHRDVQRRKSALESSAMPAKLVDCRSEDVDRTELFIVEGDSALGTAKLARDSEFQALLPIRGKILNVQKASLADMLKNAECAAIITVLGAGSGRDFNLEGLRYAKIILMADADVDGAHIRTLLLTLFHRYMPGLLSAGRVYSAVPPLHRIEVRGAGGKPGEVRYTHTDQEMKGVLADLRRRNKTWKEPVQRYKGLGEMDATQLRQTTMAPGKRTLRRVRVEDGEQAAGVFSLLMGSEVPPRKEFIINSAATVDRERIDA
ncbi:MAG: DNA gyrase/topoisomerase IV subunit B [Candidatus Nanopelagicales bacterium]